MLKKTLRSSAVLALVAAVAAPAGAASATAPPGAATGTAATGFASSLKGEARLAYEVTTEQVRVTVDAHSVYHQGSIPVRSWGTFRISHVVDGHDYWGDLKVDCLTTGGPTATVTGRLVRTSPGHPWIDTLGLGTRMGVSFLVPEDGPARAGLSGGTAKGKPLLTKCMAPAADMAVTEGGYTLHDRVARQPAG
ncbi:hypothetical protein ACWGOK_33580 [Streptomyces eurythermus]